MDKYKGDDNMAGKKSSEVMVTYKCMSCYVETSISKCKQMRMDGRSCFLCNGPIQEVEHKVSDTHLKVGVDVSDAIKGLKAVQREARKVARELNAVEQLTKDIALNDKPKSMGITNKE